MPPVFVADDQAYGGVTDPVFHRQRGLRRSLGRPIPGANGAHLVIGQFRTSMLSTDRLRVDLTAFPSHVGKVVCVSAEEKVLEPTARRVVAVMTDMHPVGNRTVGHGPGQPVGVPELAIDGELPIAGCAAGAGPDQTLVHRAKASRQPLCGCATGRLRTTAAAIGPAPAGDLCRPSRKDRATLSTRSLSHAGRVT